MTKNPTDSKLQSWLREIIKHGSLEKYVQEKETHKAGKGVCENFHIFTGRHRYCITSREAVNVEDSYLGCMHIDRKPRAGEEQHRGRDLPDGRFTRETWEAIKSAIIMNELVPLDITEAAQITESGEIKFPNANGTP